MRILLAEDEKNLRDVIAKTLAAEHHVVDACDNGVDALAYANLAEYDVVILDILMPGLDGICVLQEMQSGGNTTPVLFLTAKDSIEDRVMGLDAGASDYLVKPFAFSELLARLRVITRKAAQLPSNTLSLENLTIDVLTRKAWRDDTEILLTSREFNILEYMMRNKDIVLSREKIESQIWGYDYAGASNIVDVYIRYLRKKVDDPFAPKLIHTIRGTGYVLKG